MPGKKGMAERQRKQQARRAKKKFNDPVFTFLRYEKYAGKAGIFIDWLMMIEQLVKGGMGIGIAAENAYIWIMTHTKEEHEEKLQKTPSQESKNPEADRSA